jgi:2-polyprenyl-6-hydroxyphenyl methylase/3-demethylubiquinone-9 3-methyltransferase
MGSTRKDRAGSEQWRDEVQRGERFGFGENWAAFLRLVDEDRIASAEQSLKQMLNLERLDGKTFLDAGSGSGLFSLAARRLGAQVTSFDYDPDSVGCTAELRRRFFPEDSNWRVMRGSVLDRDFLASLGDFDVVYSWGVLHHTGSMWQALENAGTLVAPAGQLFISIYNDQGRASVRWTKVKHAYVRAPRPLKWGILLLSLVRLWGPTAMRRVFGGEVKLLNPNQRMPRGMDLWYDAKDWVGGYPFEVAKPEEIFDFYQARGFQLCRLSTCAGGIGCNEYVFRRAKR